MERDFSLLLKYSNKNRLLFQDCAEYFRLLGYFVCEYLKDDGWSRKLEQYNFDYELDLDDFSGERGSWSQNSLVDRELYDVFCANELMRASVTIQYFNVDTEIIDIAGESFERAAEQLAKLGRGEYEFRYALLYCKQKANLARFIRRRVLYCSVDELAVECVRLQKEFPNCANLSMLLGLIYEISKPHRTDAILAFVEAVKAIRNEPYAASVSYRLGKSCEGIGAARNLMVRAYSMAYELYPRYRNIYKYARQYMDEGNLEVARYYFEECIERLHLKQGYMDPLEQLYYFKVLSHLAYIACKQKDHFSAIEFAERALDFWDDVSANRNKKEGCNQFCYEIYEDSEWGYGVENIIDEELRRMGKKMCMFALRLHIRRLDFNRSRMVIGKLVKN